jgi:uncharacterized protein YdiU (UPF0061 family)
VRFGSFEVFYYRGQHHLLRELADYVIQHDYADCLDQPNPYAAWLAQVVERTAQLMAQWQSVGFMHGVMNTDNMSILGLTLDYGPFMFMEAYQPDLICNHSDDQGRYAFNKQPEIGLWNCACLAQSLMPLLADDESESLSLAREILDGYWSQYHAHFLQLMRAKLGLQHTKDDDALLIRNWLNLLAREQQDYTMAHRQLSQATQSPFQSADGKEWWQWYQHRLSSEIRSAEERQQAMDSVNPLYILRTWIAQLAIDAAQRHDYSLVTELRHLLANPFVEQAGKKAYTQPAPDWAKGLSLSCSS